MCLIIDANTIPCVFDSSCEGHARFVPVLAWITTGKGKIVYGGTKYKGEVRDRMVKYSRLVGNLQRQGKVIVLPTRDVDLFAAHLKRKVTARNFDDEHIVAIVAVSGCRVVCTLDKRAHPYLLRKDLYPQSVKRPKIYSGGAAHFKLCCDKNIAPICRSGTSR